MKITLYLYPELSTCPFASSYFIDYFNEVLSTEFEDVIIPGLGVPYITMIRTLLCAICLEVQVVTTEITFLWKLKKLPRHTVFNASGVICSGKNIRDYIITARKRSLRRLCFYTCLSFCSQGGSPGPHPGGEVGRSGPGGLQAHTQGEVEGVWLGGVQAHT